MIQRTRKVEGHFRSDVFLAFLIRKRRNVVVNLIVGLGALKLHLTPTVFCASYNIYVVLHTR